eukprot:3144760-Rhodomonas_salina.2
MLKRTSSMRWYRTYRRLVREQRKLVAAYPECSTGGAKDSTEMQQRGSGCAGTAGCVGAEHW